MSESDVENILLLRSYDQPAYMAFVQQELEGMEFLRQFGEIAYVKFGNSMKGQLKIEEYQCCTLAKKHSVETYRFLNLATNKVINSRES